MAKINRIDYIILMLISCFIVFVVTTVPASMALSVTGSIFLANVTPGQHLQHEMTVKADSSESELDYTATVIGYSQSLEGMNLEAPPEQDSGPYTARPFLNVSPSRFRLLPGTPQNLILQGDVPANAAPGERYAFVSICGAPIGNGTMAIQSAVDVLVALLVTGGEITNEGEIIGLDVTRPISPKQQNISIIFKNTGDYRYRTKAEALIESKDSRILGNASAINYNSIIPKVSRRFDLAIKPDADLKPGSYFVNATVSLLDGTILDNRRMEFKV